ncbi:uncharacterized protein LOC131604556 [Vicia villosa]|uniref:uncharacterized protein LOC131604556 n=1 Tax=Vicia villosa TaxID=3911 RepID=UPI00273A8CC4|nr:uncharacterized protein LOC131604556 [Vicia villosa]
MEIDAAFTVNHKTFYRYEVMLAFEKCSEEFVLVVLCKESSCLYVYQSRYYDWLIYSTLKSEEVVVDFVVSNNIIYVVTNNGNIGVLNLNSGNIKFLNLKNTPEKVRYRDPSQISFKLVNCDEQLLLIDFRLWYSSRRGVYKIDLSTTTYIKLKTLGDIALFYVTGQNCRALSNPERFGYRSSYVYEVNCFSQCMYDWNDHRAKLYPHGGGDLSFFDWCFRHSICQGSVRDFNFFDWCFRHLKYEVDYSLVE